MIHQTGTAAVATSLALLAQTAAVKAHALQQLSSAIREEQVDKEKIASMVEHIFQQEQKSHDLLKQAAEAMAKLK